jgi:hypothetical protein
MEQTPLQQARTAYLDEFEKDKQAKALQAAVQAHNLKVKNKSIELINSTEKYLETLGALGYSHIDTSIEYAAAWAELNRCRNVLDQIKEGISGKDYFEISERKSNLTRVNNLQDKINLLQMKLDRQAKRESLELYL